MSNVIEISIIADRSGSMNEWGKKDLMEYLLRCVGYYIQDGKFNSFNIKFYALSDKISLLDDADGYSPEGKTDISRLLVFVCATGGRSLFLSDGNFAVRKSAEKLSVPILLPVAVGCDHNKSTLKSISSSGNVYSADNILVALNDLCFGGL